MPCGVLVHVPALHHALAALSNERHTRPVDARFRLRRSAAPIAVDMLLESPSSSLTVYSRGTHPTADNVPKRGHVVEADALEAAKLSDTMAFQDTIYAGLAKNFEAMARSSIDACKRAAPRASSGLGR